MKNIVVLSGGIGGARFLTGVRAAAPDARITAIVNTADDLWIFGLRVCPDLDSVMYTLGDGIDPERRWGRTDETWHALDELRAYGESESWFGLGDRDLGTHLVRSQRLREGAGLAQVTRELSERWRPGVELVPMTEAEVATRVSIESPDAGAAGDVTEVHFQEYWIRYRAQVRMRGLRYAGIESARPTPEALAAISDADAILMAPSNPVVSIRPILAVPGMTEALRGAAAPIVGVSPIIQGGHVRGMADQLLAGLGLENSAAGVAEYHGARSPGETDGVATAAESAGPDAATRTLPGVLDGWLVDTADSAQADRIEATGMRTRAVPLYMSDEQTTRQLAHDALDLAGGLRPVGVETGI